MAKFMTPDGKEIEVPDDATLVGGMTVDGEQQDVAVGALLTDAQSGRGAQERFRQLAEERKALDAERETLKSTQQRMEIIRKYNNQTEPFNEKQFMEFMDALGHEPDKAKELYAQYEGVMEMTRDDNTTEDTQYTQPAESAAITALEEKIAKMEKLLANQQNFALDIARDKTSAMIRDAIQSNPKLASLHKQNPDFVENLVYSEADKNYDNSGKPTADLFGKAAESVTKTLSGLDTNAEDRQEQVLNEAKRLVGLGPGPGTASEDHEEEIVPLGAPGGKEAFRARFVEDLAQK
jgi:hypothetical protein